jgi:hypothetical protein
LNMFVFFQMIFFQELVQMSVFEQTIPDEVFGCNSFG